MEKTIYEFKKKDYKGEIVDFNEYKNKVLLIVNTATKCGYTPQYKGLEELYEKYKDQGFEILDFPCNQFFHQAPGSDDEICEFRKSHYKVTFKQFEKIDVNGKNEDSLYSFLKEKLKEKDQKSHRVTRNFNKFLVDRNGQVINQFVSSVKPSELEKEIEKLL